jgi:hypothetical protein
VSCQAPGAAHHIQRATCTRDVLYLLLPFAVGMPGISQLVTNYRTHQGILNTAALVVDLIKVRVEAGFSHSVTGVVRARVATKVG